MSAEVGLEPPDGLVDLPDGPHVRLPGDDRNRRRRRIASELWPTQFFITTVDNKRARMYTLRGIMTITGVPESDAVCPHLDSLNKQFEAPTQKK